jgi:acyl-CoA hydrolase
MTFLHPVRIGQLVTLKSSVNRVFRSSMEVGVKVTVEDLRTGEIQHTNSCYLTFVALDDETGRPVAVPPVIPETDAEQRRYSEAGVRRVARLEQKRQALNHESQS